MSIHRRGFAGRLGLGLGAFALAAGGRTAARADDARPSGEPAPADDEARLKAWWDDLEKEEAVAARALLEMSGRPGTAVAFLRRVIKPLTIDAERVKELLAWLQNEEEAVWTTAFRELEYFDPRLAIDLEPLMALVTETPARQRMVEVLSGRPAGSLTGKTVEVRHHPDINGYNFRSTPGGSWWAEHRVDRINAGPGGNLKKKWTRAVRAIVLLEYLKTPDAVAILKDMATGHPDAQPTRVARAALERIGSPAH